MSQPEEWGARFQALAGDAGRVAARSLRRYQDLLGRVARRELQPEEIQRQFQAYLQEQGTSSTRELVELSVGLLSGLLFAEAKSREALLDGLLPPEAPLPPPPEPAGADLMEWFQSLSTYATEQGGRAITRHQSLVNAVAKGEIPAARVQEQGRHFLEQHAPVLLDEVMQLGLNFVGRLQQSSATLTDGLYDSVLGPDRDASSPEPPVCVDLRGPAGSVASATFLIENTRSEPASVVCRASEFAARAFGRRFRAPLEIDPAQCTLAPGEHRDICLRLPLDPATFAPGADYVATLQISGAGERDLIVQLLARAESGAAGSKAREPRTAEPPATAPSAAAPRAAEPQAVASPVSKRRSAAPARRARGKKPAKR